MPKRKWDLTSKHSLDAAAEWMRKNAGGLLVLVVRGEDMAFAVDPTIAPKAAVEMVEVVMPDLLAQLVAERTAAKEAARLKVARKQVLAHVFGDVDA